MEKAKKPVSLETKVSDGKNTFPMLLDLPAGTISKKSMSKKKVYGGFKL
tara:strand:- start:602 stop:748 length:147 start_codon:yes stop_codon:yes gene_type:complete